MNKFTEIVYTPIDKALIMTEYYKSLYLAYFNDFLTITRFAEFYDLSEHRAKVIINKGRILNNDLH